MEKIFRYLGRKAGQTYSKGRWIYKTLFGSEQEAIRAEYLMGRELARRYNSDVHLADQSFQTIVEDIGGNLTERLTNSERTFHFHTIKSGDINAFALPGGFIYITDSLLRIYDGRENEIAFVLGHEIGHVVLRHAFDRLLAQTSTKFISRIGGSRSIFGNIAKSVVTQLIESQYSQSQELEADHFAIRLIRSAKYSTEHAVSALTVLRDASQTDQNSLPYFSTHPAVDKRIQEIKDQIAASEK